MFRRMTAVAYMHAVKPAAFRASHRQIGSAANIKAPQLNSHESKSEMMGVRLLNAGRRQGSQLESLTGIDRQRFHIDGRSLIALDSERLDGQIQFGSRVSLSG